MPSQTKTPSDNNNNNNPKEDPHYTNPETISKLWAEPWLDIFMHGAWASGEQRKAINKQFDTYHPYACMACKRGPFTSGTKLTRCAQCRVIKYCSKQCQREDWKSHKAWCKSFVSFKGTEEFECIEKPRDVETWRRDSNRLSMLVNMKNGPIQLHSTYIQVVPMLPRCRKCLVAGFVNNVELVTCPRCHGVALCTECFKAEQDYNQFHQEGGKLECDNHIISIACSGLVVEQGCPLTIESDTDLDECFQPKDWIEYLIKKRKDFASNIPPDPMMLMAPVIAFITDGLSIPMTILHCLGHDAVLGRDNVTSLSRLVVHVVGASVTEEMAIHKFIEISRLMPSLTYLRIVTIGPDLEEDDNWIPEGRPLNFRDPDASPIRLDCDARVLRHKGLYHEIIDSIDDEPTLTFASHSGIHDGAYTEKWRPTIEVLTSKDVPCVFTGYTLKEAVDDREKLDEFGAKVVVEPAMNPFRGLRPFPDPHREKGDFIFSNAAYVISCGSKDAS